MTMPKKNTRKIVVDQIAYRYRVKQYSLGCCDDCFSHSEVVFEGPDGKTQSIGTFEEAVTPAVVAILIRGRLADPMSAELFRGVA